MPSGVYLHKKGYKGTPHSEEWKRNHSLKLKGHTVSEETREKMRTANTGKKRSEETKAKIGASKKKLIGDKNPFFGKKHSEETKEKLRIASGSRRHSDKTKKKLSEMGKGRPNSEEHKRKIGLAHRGKKHPWQEGDKNWSWKGGITSENKRLRGSAESENWRRAVYERDGYKCIHCGDDRGHNLNADHIKPWSLYPELRFDIDNGRTLCVPCHKKTPTYGSKCRVLKKDGGAGYTHLAQAPRSKE